MLKSASRDKCNFVQLRYRCWSNILTDSMLRVSRSIRSDTLSTAFYQHCQWSQNASTPAGALHFIFLNSALFGRDKFPVFSGRGKQYYQVLTNYTLSEKMLFLHSFRRRHLWKLSHAATPRGKSTHYFWASPPSGMISERQFRVRFIHITGASFMVHRTKYSNLMCSRCVYCNYMSVVRAFK